MGQIINKISTGLNPRNNFVLNVSNANIAYITVKNITEDCLLDISNCDYVDEKALAVIHKRSGIQKGDVLFASIAPLGRCYLVETTPKTWDINESVFSIRPNYQFVSSEYLFLLLSSSRLKKLGENQSAGSIFKGIRISSILDLDLKIPNKSKMNEFTNIVKPYLERRDSLLVENIKLTRLREYLLPLLLNGQVTIR